MKFDTRQITGVLAIVFGILIFVLPDIVNYLVALFFIIWGLVSLMPAKK